jgi:hypothetical protein
LNDGACVRRVRFVMFAPDPRHPRRSQAEIPLIGLSEFGRPPLYIRPPKIALGYPTRHLTHQSVT